MQIKPEPTKAPTIQLQNKIGSYVQKWVSA